MAMNLQDLDATLEDRVAQSNTHLFGTSIYLSFHRPMSLPMKATTTTTKKQVRTQMPAVQKTRIRHEQIAKLPTRILPLTKKERSDIRIRGEPTILI